MAFGYQTLYANGLNNNTQIRRSTDMIYQRGANYNIVLTGTTYESSMELDVDLYANGDKVGRMSIVPYSITQNGSVYTYTFNLRPYDYMSNFIESQHYPYYWLNDWYSTTEQINWNNPYPNSITANFKYGYRYLNGTELITEYTTLQMCHYVQHRLVSLHLDLQIQVSFLIISVVNSKCKTN